MRTEFRKIISYAKYIGICLKYNIKSSFSNKKSFIIQTLTMFLNNFMFILFWMILFKQNNGNINGVNMNDILYLWSLPVISFGIALFLFGGVESLVYTIINGDLDLYLTLPKHSLISALTSHSRLSAMGDIIFGLLLGVFAVNFNIFQYIFLIIIAIIAGITTLCIFCIVRLLCFWLGDISKVSDTYSLSLFLTFTIYPESIFGGFGKFLMYTIVPAIYTTHFPIRIVKFLDIKLLAIVLFITLILLVFTFCLYNKGLKRYESGSSNIAR